jgi:hypothetical protein
MSVRATKLILNISKLHTEMVNTYSKCDGRIYRHMTAASQRARTMDKRDNRTEVFSGWVPVTQVGACGAFTAQ